MQKRGTRTAHSLVALAWAGLIAGSLLLPGCAASGEGPSNWSLLPDTDAELAKAVEQDPFPTASELGIASTHSR